MSLPGWIAYRSLCRRVYAVRSIMSWIFSAIWGVAGKVCVWRCVCLGKFLSGGWCLHGVSVSTKNLVIIHFCCTHIFPRDCPSCVLHFVYITPINLCASKNKTVADPGFSLGGAPTPKVGVPTYFFGRKLHENERIWTPGGVHPWRPP